MNMKRIHNIFIFILLLIGMTTFSYIPLALFKIDLSKLSAGMKVLYEFSCDIGFMIIIYVLYYESLNRDFKNYFKSFRKNFKLSIPYYVIGLIIMIISNNLISFFFTSANANNENAVRTLIDIYPLYMIFSVGIYAPFIEEIIFRKSIKDMVITVKDDNKYSKYLYIIISGFIFALLHVLGGSSWQDYLFIIPYLALGVAFAALYHKTDNIFETIVIHSMHNLIAIILYMAVGL